MPRGRQPPRAHQPLNRVEVISAVGLGIGVIGWVVLLTRETPTCRMLCEQQCPADALDPGTGLVDGDPVGLL